MKRKIELPPLPALPTLDIPIMALPDIPKVDLGAIGKEAVDLENEAKAELDAVQTEFQKRAKNEEKRFYHAVDSEYWFAVCFQTREQKEQFLKAVDIIDIGDKYLDGEAVADRWGVKLDKAEKVRKSRGISKKLSNLT